MDYNFKKEVKSISECCKEWLEAVEFIGNECASTDRIIEKIIIASKTLEKKYNNTFGK